MKHRNRILFGVLLTGMLVLGACASNKDEKKLAAAVTPTEVPATATPTQTPSPTPEVVNMVRTEKKDTDLKSYTLGKKTESSSDTPIINLTRVDLVKIFIRPASNSLTADFGEDLIGGAYQLKNASQAVFYYEKNARDADGKPVASYDIRACGKDSKEEFIFWNVPIPEAKEVRLCVDTVKGTKVPYVRYQTADGKREISTFEDAKERLGLDEPSVTPTPEATPTGTPTPTPEATAAPTPAPTDTPIPEENTSQEPASPVMQDEQASQATDFIGSSLSDLEGGMGAPSGHEYEETPDAGTTGYYYYDTFTVSTYIDENGNEIVANIW